MQRPFKPDPKPVKADKKKPVNNLDALARKMSKKEQVNEKIKDLDEVFSIFIRTRNADENGITQCFTCGKVDHWRKLQCGHYWGRKFMSTRWDEINCQVQCYKCNCTMEGNKPAFTIRLIEKYGKDVLTTLEVNKNRTMKVDVFTLDLLIKNYQSKVKTL